MSEQGEHAAFYEKHYSDWTVHELPLTVYVPSKDASREEALALVREVLDEASFDIRVSASATPGHPAEDAREDRLSEGEGIDYALVLDIINTDGAPTAALASFVAQEVEVARAEVVARVEAVLDFGCDHPPLIGGHCRECAPIIERVRRALGGTADGQGT